MKKLFFAILVVLLCAPMGYAREPKRGYRGFFDIDACICAFEYDEDWHPAIWAAGLSTSHGYQINNNWFVGAGVMFEPYLNFGGGIVPFFAEGRFDKTWGKFTPFADVRLGYAINDGAGDGVYFSPTVGYRFNFGHKVNINIGLGLNFRSMTQRYEAYWRDPATNISYNYKESYTSTRSMFNFRVGFDF